MMNTTVLGWYGKNNIGDEAYKLAFPKLFPKVNFTFVDFIVDFKGDSLVLGGGNVVDDYFLSQAAKIKKVPKHAMSVNIFNSAMLGKLKDFKSIIARNEFPEVKTMPDFTFVLQPDPIRGKKLINELFNKTSSDLYQKVIGVVINGHLSGGTDQLARDHIAFNKFVYDLSQIFDKVNTSLLFLPFGNGFPHNDKIANSWVYSKCKYWKKACLVYEVLDVQSVLDIVSALDVLVSTRLHSSIFGCIGGTPFIDVTHHDKNKVFLEFVSRKKWGLNYWKFDSSYFEELLDYLLSNHAKESYLLKRQADKYKNILENANLII